MGDTKLKSPSLVQKRAYQNTPKNPLKRRRKRKRRRRKTRKENERKRRARARAATAAAMTAVRPKTSRGGKGLKVDIKIRKLQKAEGERRTAAQGTVMIMTTEKGRDRHTVAKGESRTPTKTQV